MEDIPWWKRAVIYQVAVPSFRDSDGDGYGDLRGLLEKLDYLNDGTLRSLGVDAVWLTPIFDSPWADFGYDVRDYYTIHPRLGDLDLFRELLEQCHRRGIKVILDMVLNHTSEEHPWFVESRSSRDNPKRDWYIWRDGRAPGKPPNRWRAVVEGSAWEWDERTGQYYYHAFLSQQPDLNWRNPEVKEEMFRVCRYWLDRGVDGFRLDLINFLFEDELLRDNPRKLGLRPYDWQVHLYDRSRPESLEVVRELRRMLDGYPERMMMGEVYTDRPEDAVALLGDGSDALHLSFYLDFAMRRWRAGGFQDSVLWLERHVPPGAWPCYYLSNHDLVRHYTRLGRGGDAEARARVAAAMLLTLRGTPILYYGEEIGMPQSRIPRPYIRDPIGKKFWPLPVGRDGARTPMHWSGSRNAGFTDGEPWLPLHPSFKWKNVESQDGDPASLLNWYRRLIRLRRENLALTAGGFIPIRNVPGTVFAYLRERGDRAVAVFLNFSSRSLAFRVPGEVSSRGTAWRALLSTHREEGEPLRPAGRLELAGYEALLALPDS
ncbi:alpha-amylase family glycosyl hydrolase [Candidatus Solincola sp.]|nr:alpha-amylase family glycosyl hydrolase [Actinomycetota bacterium]MDI7253009.1 alpha-amylase family glycosyl hydrolase [Actinomycetota bacterium]